MPCRSFRSPPALQSSSTLGTPGFRSSGMLVGISQAMRPKPITCVSIVLIVAFKIITGWRARTGRALWILHRGSAAPLCTEWDICHLEVVFFFPAWESGLHATGREGHRSPLPMAGTAGTRCSPAPHSTCPGERIPQHLAQQLLTLAHLAAAFSTFPHLFSRE